MLQLSSEHPAAHDPSIDLQQIGQARVRKQNHRADKTIIAEPVNEAELQSQTFVFGSESRHIVQGMPSRRQIKLICFSDQLCDTRQIDLFGRGRRSPTYLVRAESHPCTATSPEEASRDALAEYCSPRRESSAVKATDSK